VGHCVPVRCLIGPFLAGESVAGVAHWFDVTTAEVETANRAALHTRWPAFGRASLLRFKRYSKGKDAWWKKQLVPGDAGWRRTPR
jgi:hypothetical protein